MFDLSAFVSSGVRRILRVDRRRCYGAMRIGLVAICVFAFVGVSHGQYTTAVGNALSGRQVGQDSATPCDGDTVGCGDGEMATVKALCDAKAHDPVFGNYIVPKGTWSLKAQGLAKGDYDKIQVKLQKQVGANWQDVTMFVDATKGDNNTWSAPIYSGLAANTQYRVHVEFTYIVTIGCVSRQNVVVDDQPIMFQQ